MPSYRLEEASSGRAGCQNKECKDGKIKIEKGELRLGTWVDNDNLQSFFWRHWGCVTPKIITNLNESLEDDSGGEKDFAQLDGYEDLSPENQAKIREALEQGHVSDSEWRGDIELNRPGKTGFRQRVSKKKETKEDTDSNAEEEQPKPKKRGRGNVADETDVPSAKKPKKERSSKKAANGASETPSKPARRGRSPKTSVATNEKTRNVETAAKKPSKATTKLQDDDKVVAETTETQELTSRSTKRSRKPAPTDEVDAAGDKPKRSRKQAPEQAENTGPKEKPRRGRK